MDRLISEQAVFDVINKHLYAYTLIPQIKAIPSAEPKIVPIAEVTFDDDKLHEIVEEAVKNIEIEPKWIPVSKRLPRKSEYGDVLVTYIPSAGTLWTTVMIAQYSDLMGIAKPSFHIGEVGKKSFQDITAQVTAWMPLPKPYKTESEEG